MADSEVCCGFGGTFAVKLGEISARIADNKCQHIVTDGAEAVVLGDLGCMLNIEGRLRRRGDATRVLTGHDNGLITVNVAEADDVQREPVSTANRNSQILAAQGLRRSIVGAVVSLSSTLE